ncbi:MAG: translocation/assembly module TamB domain-containing protein [Megasphaera sp.]|nr:translocation/assembly module TamB domain-containing protein [Megasphaera sp.]
MKRKWLALSAVIVFVFAACFSFWMEKPALMQKLSGTVIEEANNKLNGTLTMGQLNISWTGNIVIQDPVIRDAQGRLVVSSSSMVIAINPFKVISSALDGHVAGAIEEVNMESPELHMWQNGQDNTWNIETLIKTSSSSQEAGFRANINLYDGTVRARLANGTVLVGNDVNGLVSFTEYPSIKGTLSATIDDHDVTAKGTYRSSRDYAVTVQGDRIEASYVAPFIPDGTNLTIDDGHIDHIRVDIGQSHRGQTLRGKADIEGGAGTAYGMKFDNLAGHVFFDQHSVTYDTLSVDINGQTIHSSGEVTLDSDTPVFTLTVEGPYIDVGAFSDSLGVPVTGTAAIKGKLWGTADDMNGTVTMEAPWLSYEGLAIHDGALEAALSHGVVEVERLDVGVAGGSLRATGSYDIHTGKMKGSFTADAIHAEEIPQVPVSIVGTVSGTGDVRGDVHDINSLQGRGTFHVDGLSYNGLTCDSADVQASYSDGIAYIHSLTASIGDGSFYAAGSYDTQKSAMDIAFSATNLPLSLASSYIGVPVEGVVSAAGYVTGTGPDMDVQFHGSNGSIKGMAFDTIDGALRKEGPVVTISNTVWRYVDGTHEGSGTINMDTGALNLTVATKHMRLERLLDGVGKTDFPLTGWADNTLYITGTMENPKAKGSFYLHDGSGYGYLYKTIQSDYEFHGGTVYFYNGSMSSYDADIMFSGSVGDTLNVDIDGSHMDIARISPKKGPQRSGIMNVHAHVGGTLQNPTASGTLRAPSLLLNGMTFTDVSGDVGYYGGILRLSDFHFSVNGGTFSMNGGYNPSNRWIMARASMKSGDVGSFLKLAGLTTAKMEGRIDGDLSIDGTVENPRGRLTGQLTQATIGDKPVEPTDIDIQYEDNTIDIHKLALHVDDGVIAAQGTYGFQGDVKMQVAARNFSAKVLQDLIGRQDLDIDTRIDAVANLSGQGKRPNADVSLQLHGGTIKGISFTDMYALLNVYDGMITIDQAYVERSPYKLSAVGSIPVAAVTGERTSESMNVAITFDHAGLDILTFLTPWITSATGPLEGSLQLKGTAAQPLLYGSLGVTDGTVSIKSVRYPLSRIRGSVEFNGQSATFSASGQMDKEKASHAGTVALSANAQWEGWTPTYYEGTIQADRLNIESPFFTGPLTGVLSIQQGEERPVLSGDVTISNTTLDVPLAFRSSDEPMDLGLDFTLTLGDKVRFYNAALYDLTATGSAHFGGTVAHPHVTGSYKAERGIIHYLDTNFRIQQAEASFGFPDTFLPKVNVEAVTRVGQYNVLLNLRGPADNMDMMLRSNPPLTKNQIVSLITLHNGGMKNDSSIDSKEVNGLVGTGIRMTLNSLGITQGLEKVLKLDKLTVTTGSLDYQDEKADVGDDYYNIEMGKYIMNNFMVTAAFGLNHDDNRFGFEYTPNRFGIAAWKSNDDSFIGGVYRFNFH